MVNPLSDDSEISSGIGCAYLLRTGSHHGDDDAQPGEDQLNDPLPGETEERASSFTAPIA